MARAQVLLYTIAERVVQAVANPSSWATAYAVTVSTATPAAGATVTVSAQLVDAANQPIAQSGRTVTWSTTAGSLSAQTSNTNASGIATVVLTASTVAGTTHEVTAVDNSDISGVSPTVTCAVGAASLSVSTVECSRASMPADGSSTATVTVTLKDQYGNQLAASGGTVVVATTAGTVGSVTDADDGTYTATLISGTTPGATATISATLEGFALTDTAGVTFGSFAAPDVYNVDFDGVTIVGGAFKYANGTDTGLLTMFGVPSQVSVIPDPTGDGRGNVVRLHYGPATSSDVQFRNASARTFGYGSTWWMRSDFYIPSSASTGSGVMRKLYYPGSWVGAGDAWHVVGLQGQQVYTEWVADPGQPQIRLDSLGYVSFGAWHTLEFGMKVNTALNVLDGWFEIWLDGTRLSLVTGHHLSGTNGQGYRLYPVGYQAQAAVAITEDRYWDRYAVSTQRIGP